MYVPHNNPIVKYVNDPYARYMKAKRKTVYLGGAFARVYARRWSFCALFLAVFFVSYTALASAGIAPSSLRLDFGGPRPIVEAPDDVASVAVAKGELPMRIEIPAVGIEANVSNPNTTDVAALDRELLAGAVRYPGSGVPGEKGNVLMFGHSSHLPVVHNQAYKAFNDIQNLKKGDPIYVYGEDKVYIYAVEKVEQENTATGAIPLDVSGAKLTLATCDNFGAKSDRFVVTADLVSVQSQNNQ